MTDIDQIRDLIATERARFGVPGVAVAVVEGGAVVLCEGFGEADLDSGAAVDPVTHFPLASDTKAFTAATLCLLAGDGLIDLDAPVRDVLPWFEMNDAHTTALVTPRDLLSHRTGLPRHDVMWFGDSPMSLEETTRALRHLPVSRPIRSSWDYNNLCYIAAGHLTEVVAGMPWHEAVRSRLLEPLGMTQTVFAVQDVQAERLAQPYKATRTGYERQALPDRSKAEKAGPAGGLVSTIGDLALWVQARLGKRPEVLPATTLAHLHGAAMVGGISVESFPEIVSLGYALGCQVESYRGRRLVHHGGNTVGYSSDVGLVPDAGIGVAVLTNLDNSYLRLPLMYSILDHLHGDATAGWGERMHELQTSLTEGYEGVRADRDARGSAASPSHPLPDFAGSYAHPAYGEFVVRVEDDRLVPDLHDAGDRIELVHRGHDAWDLKFTEDDIDCPVVFVQDVDGVIAGVSAALEPAVAPIMFARRHRPVSPELLAAMVGSYRMSVYPLEIHRRGDGLVASSPIVGELVLVSRGGASFGCPAMPGLTVTAELDDASTVSRVVIDPVGIFVPEA